MNNNIWSNFYQPQPFKHYYDRPSKKERMNPSKAKLIWKAKKNKRPILGFFNNKRHSFEK